MTYRVALDEKGQMAATWLQAAGQGGIPCAFLVDKQGRIAWIGHPMKLPEELITKVLAGSFDPQKAAAANEAFAKNQEALAALQGKLTRAAKDQQWNDAEDALAEMEKLLPGDEGLALARLRLCIARGDQAALKKAVVARVGDQTDNATLQNELAWTIATTDHTSPAALEVADTLAERANEITKGKEPSILSTMARIAFLKGKKNRALDLQQRAIDASERKNKNELRKALVSYQAGKLPAAR